MNAFSRLFPAPFVSVVLLTVWLLLWNSLDPLIVASGVVLAIALARSTYRYWPSAPGFRRPLAVIELVAIVGWDIVVANVIVAVIVLVRGPRVEPARVEVPLDVSDPFVATLLSSTVTLTPGTLSAELDVERGRLEVHCLHLDEPPADLVERIKTRYESRLREVFGC